MLQERPANKFGIAFILAILSAVGTGIFILVLGKNGSFQLINRNHNEIADQFFKYFTHYGDGVMWAPLVLFCFFFKKKYFITVLAGVIISTLLAQFLKRIVYPDELRPFSYLSENFPVHLIDSVPIRKIHSFPSGHTTTAFTMALIMAHIINKKPWSVILIILACLVGYSRVYLAQHFLTDVLGGICIGIFSGMIALLCKKSERSFAS